MTRYIDKAYPGFSVGMPEQLCSSSHFSYPLPPYDHTSSMEYIISQIMPFSQCFYMYLCISPQDIYKVFYIFAGKYAHARF